MRHSNRTAALAAVVLSLCLPLISPGASAEETGRLIPIGRGPDGMLSVAPFRDHAPRARMALWQDQLRRMQERRQEAQARGLHGQRSPRNILSPDYQAFRSARARMARRAGRSAGLGDTLVVRVAGIRVGFREADKATRPDFDLRPIWDPERADTLLIDAPPHDRAFFLKHMEAMNQYWKAMFYGNLRLEYDVFPPGDSSYYLLDSLSTYGDYELGTTGIGGWTVDGLELLVKDCLRAADADTSFRFQDWDSYMIIHAGPDFQTDINRDSPHDVPSFYIYFGDTLWTDVTGVDSFPVVDATMLPESSSQDGLVGAVNGVFAHEFGHQLGLPDLYDVLTGFPAVGFWGVMDSGNQVAIDLGVPVTGILPASLSAWCKYILSTYLTRGGGFLDVKDVETMYADSLRAVEMGPGNGPGQVLKIPLTSEEYYLVENRQDDVDGNRATFVGDSLVILDGIYRPTGPDTLTGALYQDKETGVILGPSRFAPRDESGELPPFDEVRSWEYDAGLPGPGLLVWHIDDAVVFDLGLQLGGWVVNGDPNRRGIKVKEADGILDLGDWRSFYWQGSQFDPYFAGNADTLTPYSYPNTNSALGGRTGVRLTDIGPLGRDMYLRVDRGYGLEGFPQFLYDGGRRGAAGASAASGDVDGDGIPDLVLTRGGRVIALAGGEGPVTSLDLPGWPVASGAPELGPAALGDVDGDGRMEVAARGADGRLYLWQDDGAPYFPGGFNGGASFTDSLSARGGPPVLIDLDGDVDHDAELVAGVGTSIRAYDDGGGSAAVLWSVPVGALTTMPGARVAAVAGLENALADGGRIVVLTTSGDVAVLTSEGKVLARWSAGDARRFTDGGYLALADFDRGTDGVPEVLALGAGGTASIASFDGAFVDGHWPADLGGTVSGPPAIGDVDGDGRLEAAVPIMDVGVFMMRDNGTRIPRTPWKAPVGAGAAPVMVDLEGDGTLETIVSATDGLVYGWFSDGGTIPGWPLGLGRNPLSPASVVDFRTGDSRPELVLLDGIGALEVVRIPGWQDGSGTVAWGEAYGGAARLSHQGAVLGAPTSSGTLLTGEGFYVYPNPTRGANPRLHFELGRDATGTIEIFTLSGERVRSWTGPLHMPADEWEWDVSDLASGLYLCRVRVSSGGEEKSFTHKVAVIR